MNQSSVLKAVVGAVLLLVGAGFVGSASKPTSAPAAQLSPAPATRYQPATAFPAPVTAAPSAQTLTISGCNGSPAHANFREYPSFSPRSILGVVAIGESVNLTGRTTRANGERWYESVNPAQLHPTPDVGAQNRTGANQPGWIAACFVSG